MLLDLLELEKFEAYVPVKLLDILLQSLHLLVDHTLLRLSTLNLVFEVICAGFKLLNVLFKLVDFLLASLDLLFLYCRLPLVLILHFLDLSLEVLLLAQCIGQDCVVNLDVLQSALHYLADEKFAVANLTDFATKKFLSTTFVKRYPLVAGSWTLEIAFLS